MLATKKKEREMKETIILKGNIIFTKTLEEFQIHKDSYIVAINGKVEGIYEDLPQEYANLPVADYGDKLIIPGFSDLHLHGGQYLQCGMGMTDRKSVV